MKIKVTDESIYVVTLTLSELEARALKSIVGNVGGTPGGIREVSDKIYDALSNVKTFNSAMDWGSMITPTWEDAK